MANIDRIVTMNIALNTSVIGQLSFDQIMILVPGAWATRVNIITDADDLLIAPFSLTTSAPGYLAALACFSQTPSPRQVYIGRVDAGDASPAVTMAAITAENNSFYVFGEAARTTSKAVGYAAWAEANKKLFIVGVTGDDGVQGTLTDVAGLLKTGNYYRSFPMHYNVSTDFPEFALWAKKLQTLPGGETYALTTLAGVQAANLTETQYQNIKFRNSNTFEPFRNLNLTQNGKVSAGEWADLIRGRDWLEEEAKTSVLNMFIDRRVPFTDVGIRIVKSGLVKALTLGQQRGLIALDTPNADNSGIIPGFTVSVPNARDISTADKAARILRDVTFRAVVQGSIHSMVINGSLNYDVA